MYYIMKIRKKREEILRLKGKQMGDLSRLGMMATLHHGQIYTATSYMRSLKVLPAKSL